MKTVRSDRLVWLDLETTGLSPTQDIILELGIMITDASGNIQDSCNWTVRPMKRSAWDHSRYENIDVEKVKAATPEIVQDMHTDSGLWHDVAKARDSLFEVGRQLPDYLRMNGFDLENEQLIIAGNGIDRFDRLFLEANKVPLLNFHMLFHYRSVDVSNLYHTARLMGVNFNEALPAEEKTAHRALDDCAKSVREYVRIRTILQKVKDQVPHMMTYGNVSV